MSVVRWKAATEWNKGWALAVVFGLASIPWTYGFVAGLEIPLWPSFIASATFYRSTRRMPRGLTSGLNPTSYETND